MRDITHVDEKVAKHITGLLAEDKDKAAEIEAAQKKDAKETVEFYKNNYDFVQLVKCSKCGSDLCLWVLDRDQVQPNMVNHHLGLRRIVIGTALLASRKRLDGAMGYHCGAQVPNIEYEAELKEVTAFNKKQDKLKEAGKKYEEHRNTTLPPTVLCDNDTRLSPIEKGILEEQPWNGGTVPAIDPHVEAKIKQKIIATNFQPDVQDLGQDETMIEGFHHKVLQRNQKRG